MDQPADTTAQPADAIARLKAAFPRSYHLQIPFLESYQVTENQTESCKKVGVSHETVSQWKKNADFMVLFTATHIRAQQKNNDSMRDTAVQLAIGGTPHYLIKNGTYVLDDTGKRTVAYREFYPQLMMFMLKNRLPDEFKDKFEHEIKSQVINTLASEFFAIVRRNTPEICPHCSNRLDITAGIRKELETASAKMTGA